MSILNQIEDNVLTDLRLDETNDEVLGKKASKLIQAIGKNTSIESIHFNGEYLGCLRSGTRTELIELIGGLPNLVEVHMSKSLLMASALTAMIAKAKQLRVLKLTEICIQGENEDISATELALLAHPSLKEFEMEGCMASAFQEVSLDKLEKAGSKQTTVVPGERKPSNIRQVSNPVA